MRTATQTAPAPAEQQEGPKAGTYLWRRRFVIFAVVALVSLIGGALILDRLQSDQHTPRPTFAEKVTPRGTEGRFEAATTNLGDRGRAPACTVSAFDIYGNTVGSHVYELDKLSAGEHLDWDGRLEVTATVERMAIVCS